MKQTHSKLPRILIPQIHNFFKVCYNKKNVFLVKNHTKIIIKKMNVGFVLS